MHAFFKTGLTLATMVVAGHVAAQVTFYEHEGFQGRAFTAQQPVDDFRRLGFNDRASSVVVLGERREVCEDAGYGGRCVILLPGQYPSLAAMGLNDRISSERPLRGNERAGGSRYAPIPQPAYDNRRRDGERLFQADVTSARAIMGTPQQRCWTERQQVQQGGGANIPGALVGALIGGVLGHQVGGGRGKDIATAGGAVAGAAVGYGVGGGYGAPQTQDVQRCNTVPASARPAYWDVSYNFRGQEHRVQMTTQPGPTITVNRQGEPRA
jgi:uncharacterized protein YcfJ